MHQKISPMFRKNPISPTYSKLKTVNMIWQNKQIPSNYLIHYPCEVQAFLTFLGYNEPKIALKHPKIPLYFDFFLNRYLDFLSACIARYSS